MYYFSFSEKVIKLSKMLIPRRVYLVLCLLMVLLVMFTYLDNRTLFSIRRINRARYGTNTNNGDAIKTILDTVVPPSVEKRKLSSRHAKLTPQAAALLKHWPQGKVSFRRPLL